MNHEIAMKEVLAQEEVPQKMVRVRHMQQYAPVIEVLEDIVVMRETPANYYGVTRDVYARYEQDLRQIQEQNPGGHLTIEMLIGKSGLTAYPKKDFKAKDATWIAELQGLIDVRNTAMNAVSAFLSKV